MTGEVLDRAEAPVYVPEMLRAPYPSSNPSATRADADPIEMAVGQLTDFLAGQPVLVLSGAGCSTESGIPDYRGLGGGRSRRRPMGYQEFMGSPRARARYWARSAVGWSRVSRALPNSGHHALARMEALRVVRSVITQNVDGLHHAAGSRTVAELHGSLSRVRCVECARTEPRADMQRRLEALNLRVPDGMRGFAPDGDADLAVKVEHGFVVPACKSCGGILKPDVVFFGETVPSQRLVRCWELYDGADALLVVGSSLEVFSGRRFVIRAAQENKPIAIVNMGPTRCDETAQVRAECRLGQILPQLADALSHRPEA